MAHWSPIKNITQLNTKLGFSVTHIPTNVIQKISLYSKSLFYIHKISLVRTTEYMLWVHAFHAQSAVHTYAFVYKYPTASQEEDVTQGQFL